MSVKVRGRLSDGISAERLWLEGRRARRWVLVYLVMAMLGLGGLAIEWRNSGAGSPFENRREVRIVVDNASGVKPGLHDVRISGLRVGKITSAELLGGRAVLTLSLGRELGPIYRDSRLRLRPQTPLQDLYVDVVDRGSKEAGELPEGEVLTSERTRTQVDVGAVLNTFQADSRRRMEIAMDELGRGLDDRGDSLRRAFVELAPFLRGAERISRELARRGRLTARMVHSMRLLTEEVARRDEELGELVEAGAATLTTTADAGADLDRLLVELPPTVERVRSSLATLRGSLDELDPALEALRPTAVALAPGLDALQRIAEAGTPALGALRSPVRRLRPLAELLEPTARSLDRAFPPLAALGPRLDRATARLVPCELALQKFFQWTPSVFKFADENGAVARGDTQLGTESVGGAVATPNLEAHPSCADPEGGG